MKETTARILFFTAVVVFLLFLPIFLGLDLLVENNDSLNSTNISKSIQSTSFRESLLCSVALLLIPLIEILADFIPDDRPRDVFDVCLKLIRVLSSVCPQVAMISSNHDISFVSYFPAIFGSQQVVLLMVFSLVYLQHGSSVWRPNLIFASFGTGILPIVFHCYSAYFLSKILGIVTLCIMAVTTFAFTLLLVKYVVYMYNSYNYSPKKISNDDYICGLHMFGQWAYATMYLILFLMKDGLMWQDASAFQLCTKVYSTACLNAVVSVFYDRLLRRDLSWTQVHMIMKQLSCIRLSNMNMFFYREHWKANGYLSVTYLMRCGPLSTPLVWV